MLAGKDIYYGLCSLQVKLTPMEDLLLQRSTTTTTTTTIIIILFARPFLCMSSQPRTRHLWES